MIRNNASLLLVLTCAMSSPAAGQSPAGAATVLPPRPLTLAQAEELLRLRSLAVAATRHSSAALG